MALPPVQSVKTRRMFFEATGASRGVIALVEAVESQTATAMMLESILAFGPNFRQMPQP
jgi:hypothetical protein